MEAGEPPCPSSRSLTESSESQQVQETQLLCAGERKSALKQLGAVASSQSLAQTGLVAASGIQRLL